MLSVIMLSVVMLSVIMLCVVMLNVLMLNVIMLNVVMLSVAAPKKVDPTDPAMKMKKKIFQPFLFADCITAESIIFESNLEPDESLHTNAFSLAGQGFEPQIREY